MFNLCKDITRKETNLCVGGSQWPRRLRRGSAVSRLLGLWVRIPSGTWKLVCFECCVLSGREV